MSKNKPHNYYNVDLKDAIIPKELPNQFDHIIIEDVGINVSFKENVINKNNRIYDQHMEIPFIDLNNIKTVKIEHVEKLLDKEWTADLLHEVYDENGKATHLEDQYGKIYPLDYFENDEEE